MTMRVFLEPQEGVQEVVKKVSSIEDKDVLFVVPKDSVLKTQSGAFARLAKEMKTMKKRAMVESVDEKILSLASRNGLEGVHPFFGENRGKAMSDIVPREKKKKGEKSFAAERGTKKSGGKSDIAPVPVPIIHEEEITPNSSRADKESKTPRKFPKRIGVVVVGTLAIAAAGYGAAILFWSKVTVELEFMKEAWGDEGIVRATKTVSKVTEGSLTIPGEVFTLEKNLTELVPATGKAIVSRRATGKLVITNAFGVQPQTLVARTRFATPDGKIFRIEQSVVVPGAKLEGGKLVPSEITVTAIADGTGASYNIGPVEKLSIPGFAGTTKANGFYGALPGGASGGASGEQPVPTKADIEAAKKKVESALRAVLVGTVKSSMPDDFTLLDDATRITITKLTVNDAVDQGGNFSVYGAAQMKAVGFRESDVRVAFEGMMKKERSKSAEKFPAIFKEAAFSYTAVTPKFDAGEVSFTATGEGILWADFDPWEFEQSILGKSVTEAKNAVARVRGVSKGLVGFWPQYLVYRIPTNPDRVEIIVK